MSVEQLITEHLDIWTAADTEKKSGRGRSSGSASSVYGIKKLRELILELAVRGKLVPQDESDEPASELLKRIAAEKAKLIAEGKIKKDKTLPEITLEDIPYELPEGWIWERVAVYVFLEMGQSPPSSYYNQIQDGLPFFQGKADLGDRYPIARYWCTQPSKYAFKGDVLLSVRAPVGPTNITPYDCCIGRGLAALRPLAETSTEYILFAMRARQTYLEEKATGTTFSAVSKGDIEPFLIPIPPLGEQHRIVAKVDGLMTLCDQLENQHNKAAEAHEKLVTYLLGTLTQSQNVEDFNTNWQRISEHFDTLFTTEASIDALKQTLLQLAVMGKLVPQDLNDEPAIELLKRIQAEKAKLIAEGKIKKDIPLAEIMDEDKPFDLPVGWKWVRKNEVFAFLNGYAFKSEWFESSGIKLLRNVNVSHGKANWSDPAYISIEQAANFNEYMLNVDDLVLSLDRPIITTGLKYAIISKADIPCLLLQRIAKVSSFCKVVNSEYLAIWLNSSFFVGNIDPGRSNGVPHISTTQVANMCFALPPTAEQWRIVAKVDELMAICDQLKVRLTAANQLQQKLADVMTQVADC